MRFSWTFKLRLAALLGIVVILQGTNFSQAQFAPISNPSQAVGQQTPAAGQNYAQPKTSAWPQSNGQLANGQPGNYGQTRPQSFGQTTQPSYGQVTQQVQTQQPVQVPQQVQPPQQSYVQPQQQSQQPQQSYTQPQQPRIAYNPPVNQSFNQYQANGQQPTTVQSPLFGQSQQAVGQFQSVPQYTAKAFQDGVAQQPSIVVAPEGGDGAAVVQAAPAINYGSSSYGSCDTSGVGYNTFAQGCDIGSCGCQKSCRRWFGGVYGLLMERDSHNYRTPLAYTTSTGNAAPYYPTSSEVAMTTSDVSTGFQGGMEIRIGATLNGHLAQTCGIGSRGVGYNTFDAGCCGCSSACCCGPTLAWEAVYWGLPEESSSTTITDMSGDGTRTYGMMPYTGWEHNAGAGYRPLNDYFDYGSPTTTNDVEVRSLTVRRSFSAQNAELNLLRLPILNGCGGQGACGCGPRYELTTLVGARFLRFDDDFSLESNWENMTSSATGTVTYNSEIDNNLYGLQFGFNGACRFGRCGRWGLHSSTSLGVFGNSISARQWVPGTTRYMGGANEPFDISSSKDDVAMLGELRLGASYQYSCNWRFYGGWRAIGISGVATATDQASSAPVSAGWIDSSGSLILHGLQAGVECTY